MTWPSIARPPEVVAIYGENLTGATVELNNQNVMVTACSPGVELVAEPRVARVYPDTMEEEEHGTGAIRALATGKNGFSEYVLFNPYLRSYIGFP